MSDDKPASAPATGTLFQCPHCKKWINNLDGLVCKHCHQDVCAVYSVSAPAASASLTAREWAKEHDVDGGAGYLHRSESWWFEAMEAYAAHASAADAQKITALEEKPKEVHKQNLCIDEGCPHFGIPHVCLSRLELKMRDTSTSQPPQPKGEPPMPLRALNDRVIVRPDTQEDTTTGGIVIPDAAKDGLVTRRGIVLSVGYKCSQVIPGNLVIYNKYHGLEVAYGNEKLLAIREEELLGIDEVPISQPQPKHITK